MKKHSWIIAPFHILTTRFPMSKYLQKLFQNLKPIFNNVQIIQPLGYAKMMQLLSNVKFVISDSGGLQEECASFKKKIIYSFA